MSNDLRPCQHCGDLHLSTYPCYRAHAGMSGAAAEQRRAMNMTDNERWQFQQALAGQRDPIEWQRQALGQWAPTEQQRAEFERVIQALDSDPGIISWRDEREKRARERFDHAWSAFCLQWVAIAACASPLADVLTEHQRGDEPPK